MSYEVKQCPIEEEYAKNSDISPEEIAKLKEWLDTQPHLPGKYLDELDILLAYHCCRKSTAVTKHVLDLHYTLRTLFTHYFKDRRMDPIVEKNIRTILFAPLPTTTKEGYRVFYARLLDTNPENFSPKDALKTFMMIFDLWQYEEGTWPGFVLILDLDKTKLSHLMRVELSTIKEALYFLQECMLVKLRSVHFLNAPYFVDKLMMMLKPFIKKEYLSFLHIHQGDSTAIYETLPKRAFPKEEGGDYENFQTIVEKNIKRLHDNSKFFEMENKRRVVEELRPGEATKLRYEFGTEGSFKKLDID